MTMKERKTELSLATHLHCLGMMQSFDSVDGVLLTSESNEGTGFTFPGAVPQHRTFLDHPVSAKHVPDVVLRELFRQHTDKQLALCNNCRNIDFSQ